MFLGISLVALIAGWVVWKVAEISKDKADEFDGYIFDDIPTDDD